MSGPRLGAHVSAAGSLDLAFARGRECGAESLQIFTRAPGRWRGRSLGEEEIQRFRASREEAGHPPVLAHDLYLTNLAAADPEVRGRSINSQVEELGRCAALGVDGLVCHMGAALDAPEEEALARLADGVREVLDRTEGLPVRLLLETTAGQGTCLGHRFEHLARVLERCRGEARLGVCLDTCHVFAAGYDLQAEEAYEDTWTRFDQLLGLDRLGALHLNDSRKGLGSRVDRHAHIGAGALGEAPFRRLVRDPRFKGLPMILETPEAESMHRVNLARLKALRGD